MKRVVVAHHHLAITTLPAALAAIRNIAAGDEALPLGRRRRVTANQPRTVAATCRSGHLCPASGTLCPASSRLCPASSHLCPASSHLCPPLVSHQPVRHHHPVAEPPSRPARWHIGQGNRRLSGTSSRLDLTTQTRRPPCSANRG